MVVLIANDLPNAIRGRLKLWFIEPKPNVFVAGIKDSVADAVVKYLMEMCPNSSGLVIFQSLPKAPGYKIYTIGESKKEIREIFGLQLVVESILPTQDMV